jgi:hypothetical protein
LSQKLIDFAKKFLTSSNNCQDFCDEYIRRWNEEGDRKILIHDDSNTSLVCSSIFCIADMFADEESRVFDFEYDETKLRLEIKKTLDEFGF